MSQTNSKVGRPSTGKKEYGSVRLERTTADKINALKLLLHSETQDMVVNKSLNTFINGLNDNERKLYDTLLPLVSKDKKQ